MVRYNIDGEFFDDKDSYLKKIVEILRLHPMTPSQLTGRLARKSREETFRSIIKPLLNKGLIQKQADSHKYEAKGQLAVGDSIVSTDTSKKAIEKSQSIQNWRKRTDKTKYMGNVVNQFVLLCMGKRFPEFKINPDLWNHPKTTDIVVSLAKKYFQRDEPPSHFRMMIANFLKYGLKISLEKYERKDLGLGGHHDNKGGHSKVSFAKDQYELAKNYSKKNPRVEFPKGKFPSFLLFGVHFWTFVRPSVLFTLRLDQIEFYDRTVQSIQDDEGNQKLIAVIEDGEKTFFDSVMYSFTKKYNIEIKSITGRAAHFKDVYEPKTKDFWPKFCYDNEIVVELEKYVASRLHQGKRFLFWNDNANTFDKKGSHDWKYYNHIVAELRYSWNRYCKDMFKEIGCTDESFFKDSSYSMRHVGVQHWLIETEYDYGLIGEMGWSELGTLITWYGGKSRSTISKLITKAMAK